MDWYVIKYLYPESFNKFVDVMFPYVGVISLTTLEMYDLKKLYRFFDKEGIYLTIEMYHPNRWVYSISLYNGIVFGPDQEIQSSRDNVESIGFGDCFKILDKILRDETKDIYKDVS